MIRAVPKTSATREWILESASPLLYREGLRGAGVDAIVAATGLAKATVYRHFPSKDLLVEAFLRRRDRTWRAWLEGAVAERAAAGVPPALAVFEALGDWFASDDFRGCAFINAAAEITNPDHPALDAVREHKRLLRDYLRVLVAGGDPAVAEARADALLLLVEGAIVTAQIEKSPAAAARARRAAAALIHHSTEET
jgi:AcrR family transcriptional regulator